MDKKHIITIIVVAVVVGVLGFFGGYKLGQAKASPKTGQFSQNNAFGSRIGANATGARRTGTNGNTFANGKIISKDSNSITLQLQNNMFGGSASSTSSSAGSRIVLISGSAQISKFASGTPDDLTIGSQVIVTGTANPDGTMTAQTVQVRPSQNGPAPSPQ